MTGILRFPSIFLAGGKQKLFADLIRGRPKKQDLGNIEPTNFEKIVKIQNYTTVTFMKTFNL